MPSDSEGNSKRANIRLDHMETDLREIKDLAKERNQLHKKEAKERNARYVGLCEDVVSLKTEVRIYSAIVLAAATAMIINYLVG